MVSRAAHSKILELSKPPGPPSFWFGVGAVFRQVGKIIDEAGRSVQSGVDAVYDEKLPVPCTAVKLAGKSPAVGTSFVAPSATLAGAVDVKAGASVWYGAIVRAQGAPVIIGEMSNIQENATVTAKPGGAVSVGKLVTVGAGSVVEASTISDKASVGCGCIVPAGCTIGKGAVLLGGSVLSPKTTVPAGQVWSGKPAKKVADLSDAVEAACASETRSVVALSIVHQEHAWMPLDEIEFQHSQYKVESARPENWSQQLRDAPHFEELPKLSARIAEVSSKIPAE
mmetsp:Transcript_21026/g.56593  ORF Transcript_21026/g.56593 Transcript_21026/m.56593 type:complete len:283 (-) Transcript_21026:550-1398(-)